MKTIILIVLVFLAACGDTIIQEESQVDESTWELVDCKNPCRCIDELQYKSFESDRQIFVYENTVWFQYGNANSRKLKPYEVTEFREHTYNACMFGFRDPFKPYEVSMSDDTGRVWNSFSWPPLAMWAEELER